MSQSVTVAKRPQCSFCPSPAQVDGKTVMGPWAHMCRTHFKGIGVGLGTGLGQILVVKGEFDDQDDHQGTS